MFRRAIERISLFIGGALIGAIGFYEYENSRINLPVPFPPLKLPKEVESVPVGPLSDYFQRKAYNLSYNRRLRQPNWVYEHLTKESLKRGEGVDRSKSRFLEDREIPEKFRARLPNYVGTGYDRGHMAPAADAKLSQEALDETFLLSNMAPQVGNGFNRDYWAYFEEFCRRLINKEEFKDVYVITGPAYLAKEDKDDKGKKKWYVKYEVIGNPPNIAVPTHYYKVILAVKDDPSKPDGHLYALSSFIMPNERIKDDILLENWHVPLDALERETGLTFFENVKNSVDLCKVSKCILVANPKHVREELRSVLPEPSKNETHKK